MMAQQYATDEAGNVWEVSGPQPVFVSAAGGAQNTVVGPNPLKVQAAQTDLSNDQLSGRRTAQQIALEAARVPVAAQVAQADASKATADAERARLEVDALRKKSAATAVDPASGLQRAINEMRKLFPSGPGGTSGIGGALDFLPTEGNKNFDRAASAARGYVGPALGLTASQLNTPGEIDAAIGPYIPKSSDYDSNILKAFDRLQGLADDQRRRAGYIGPVDRGNMSPTSPADQRRNDDPRAATIGNAGPPSGGNPRGPAGYDVAGVAGGVGDPSGGGGGFSNAAGLAMAQKLSKAYTAGAGVSQLNELLRNNGYQEFTDPQSIAQINKRGPLNFAPPQVDDSRSGLGRAIGDNLNNGVGAYAVGAADALTAGNLDTLAGGQTRLAQDYLEKNNPTASLLGTVTGGALAAGGAELGLARAGLSAGRAALAGDALYGGAYGAGSADGGNRLLGALAGATGGAVGGVAGRGLGRALQGSQNADVAGLRRAGVPTTVGQTLGGVAKGVEDRLSGLPFVGNMVNARRLEGMQAFNRAAFDEALAPINANTGGVVAEQGIDAAQGAVGRGYRQALDGVNLTPDAQFNADLAAVRAQGASIPRTGPEFDYVVQQRVDPLVAGGNMSGEQFQDVLQGLRGADLGSDAMGTAANDALGNVAGVVRGLADRQAPGAVPALAKADQAYRQVQVLKDAVNRARGGTRTGETGIFAPSQLGDAAAANAKKFGNGQGTTRQPFFNLARAGQNVLPNSVPDSGTAGRAVVASGLGLLGGGALGGGAGYATGDTGTGAGTGLALAALLAAGGTKTGQKALVKLLADRPDAVAKLGGQVRRYGGIFGAPLVAPIATGIVPQ